MRIDGTEFFIECLQGVTVDACVSRVLHAVVSGLSRVYDVQLRITGNALRISAIVEKRVDVAMDAETVRTARTRIPAIDVAVDAGEAQ